MLTCAMLVVMRDIESIETELMEISAIARIRESS